ncbi:MAG: hypothetical protein AAGK78_17045, partial [Planctomycetota bacterium]
LGVAVLGGVLCVATWLRIPADNNLPPTPIDDGLAERLSGLRRMHLAGLVPQLLLTWLQIGVLIAISVAISTRFSLVVNLPATLLLYVAGNLTRFVDTAVADQTLPAKAGAFVLNTVLPFLRVFDATDETVYSPIAITGFASASDPQAVTVGAIWLIVAAAVVYFAGYVGFVLTLGTWSLRRRDLGGNDG